VLQVDENAIRGKTKEGEAGFLNSNINSEWERIQNFRRKKWRSGPFEN